MKLHAWHWPAAQPRGAVVLIHGAAEHCGRYSHVATRLNAAGWSVYGADLPGHGASDGRRGDVRSFDEYLLATDDMVAQAASYYPALPLVLFGHSMGGLIAIRYLQTRQGTSDKFRGLVLSSPALDVAFPVTTARLRLGRAIRAVWPTFAMPIGLSADSVSRDVAVVRAYASDPLVTTRSSVRWQLEFYHAMRTARNQPLELQIPTLVMQAGADKLVSPAATRAFVAALSAPNKRLVEFPALYHELLNEPERDQVFAVLLSWLDGLWADTL